MYETLTNFDEYRGLLEEYGIPQVDLSKSQKRALDLFTASKNVLIIGSAGVGKSFLIKEMKYQSKQRHMVVTATTGIAAYNVNGLTLNSFMGVGTGEQSVDILVKKVQRKRGVRERIRCTDILVVDEASMLSAELFEKINVVCQTIRRSSAPFGGIQVILSCDMLQLLPIFKRNTFGTTSQQDTRLLFESSVFKKYFNAANTVTLTENFRQTGTKFKETLLRIRMGEHTDADVELLRSRMISRVCPSDALLQDAVHLVSSNRQAQAINMNNLNTIDDEIVEYNSAFSENGDKELCVELTRELQSQFELKGINKVRLKKGARVMLIKNLSVEEGLVNGSVGTIDKFTSGGYPIVKFDNRVTREILPVEWELEFGDSTSKAVQVPLMLCWAITCHKSQSLTLDKAVMTLGDAFCDHQIYVALSRIRTLEGLYLDTFDPKKITVNEKVKEFLRTTA